MTAIDRCWDFPEPFQPSALHQSLKETLTSLDEDRLQQLESLLTPNRVNELQKVLITSEFALKQWLDHPQWLIDLLADPLLDAPVEAEHFQKGCALDCEMALAQWDCAIRQFRNRAMTRIIWRDFNRLADTQGTCCELTFLAEALINASLRYHYHRLVQELGEPQNQHAEIQPMLVIGMGKLGAWELNLSSDVDLIFAYPDNGETCGARKSVSNQEFFTRLGQRLIKTLDAFTRDGFCFRVDMRLRPYGQSGALVSSFNALEDYYQTQGREWERFAMIKARVIASNGPQHYSRRLMKMLRSFTYRRYVDFSAIDALRNLKQLINREVVRRKLHDNVKLGRGGIREVEFIAQAFQIIRGGRDTELQDRRLLVILPLLRQLRCLPEGVDESLTAAYLFLRNAEHAIQGYQDQQTQQLPEGEANQARLAYAMGFDGWENFYRAFEQHRELIHEQFKAVIADPDEESDDEAQQALKDWQGIWLQANDPQVDLAGMLEKSGFDQPEHAEKLVRELLRAPPVLAMHAIGRERLDQFMPRLLARLQQAEQPSETLARLLKLIIAIARRSAYLLLLVENPGALNQLVILSEASPWIADRLAEHPALLDELLDPGTLYSTPAKQDLAAELHQQVLRIPADDLEAQMEALRYFRNAHALQVAACEVTGKLPLMKVSDYLTELAEVIVEYVLHLGWQQMVTRHGHPEGQSDDAQGFMVLGYGKLGGIELSHGSDLDLVFVHDADPQGTTAAAEGQKPIDNATFYMRLGQKIIHMLSAHTPSGRLYEVDMRLRPSGNSGLLVSSFSGFAKYQFESAWTWEHQALARARAIAGDALVIKQFWQLRHDVLCRERERQKLRDEVVAMRQKMRQQLGTSRKEQADGRFQLKQDEGGIVDIEFMVQYAVLAWARNEPKLTHYSDNIRILECLAAAGLLDAQEVHQLIEAYKAFRSIGHRLALQQQAGVVDGQHLETERQTVIRIWQQLLGPDPG